MIQDLTGWPPAEFQCAEETFSVDPPQETNRLLLDAATFVPGHGRPGDVVLLLVDPDQPIECTARLKVGDPDLALRALAALSRCRGMTLAQAGVRQIPEEA